MPRKFSFIHLMCTHVEVHHRSQFSKIKYGPSKYSAMIRMVQEWVRDIKREPVILEKEADEEPDVPATEMAPEKFRWERNFDSLRV